MNWLERARREICEKVQPPTANSAVGTPENQESSKTSTANTAVRLPTAVTAVPRPAFLEKHEGPEEGSFARLPELSETQEPPPSNPTHTTADIPGPSPPVPGPPGRPLTPTLWRAGRGSRNRELRSPPCGGRRRTGQPRTGGGTTMSVPVLPSTTASCLGSRLRRLPTTAVSPSGCTSTQHPLMPTTGASSATNPIDQTTACCPSGLVVARSGCIVDARRHGAPPG